MTLMTQSRLSSKIKICEYLEFASKEQTLEVIEWMKHELQCTNMNKLLIKVFMKSKELFTNDALLNISNRINLNKADKKQSPSNGKHLKTNKGDSKMGHLLLLKLPYDLINNVALLLNESDLLYFERCTRMFYRMINNSTFLKKCRSFKKFIITRLSMSDIISQRIDCYKYSFAHELVVAVHGCDDNHEDDYWQLMKNMFQSMAYYGLGSYKYHSNWLTSIFTSIVKLEFSFDGMIFLDLMPIELLFDKNHSKLSRVDINHYLGRDIPFKSFRRKYLNYFNQEARQIREDKILDMLTVYGGTSNDGLTSSHEIAQYRVLHMRHLDLEEFAVDCTSFQNVSPHLKRLTLRHCSLTSRVHNNNNNNNNIDTLRLLGMSNQELQDILFTESFINTMNFDSNLKNLTIDVVFSDKNMGYLSSIFQKEHLFNLENVNILFLAEDETEWIDHLFDVLIHNIGHLKHQFKQLNFGISKTKWYDFFSWNSTINAQFINNKRKQWKSSHVQSENNSEDCSTEKTKFELSAKQWV